MTTDTTRLTPPGTIIVAFFGFLVSTVAALVTAGFLLGARDELAAVLRKPNLTQQELDRAVTLAQGFAIGVVLLVGLVYLWLSFKLKAGRNWARVMLTVFTLLQVASLFATEGDTTTGYAGCAIAVLALVASYLPPSNVYIAERKHAS
ncbi:hypothetical protein [Actinophytocola oryzae]|uniref:Uncharacterized protein n=1 Tax=Actinophytocola oryzae TaxID=502181 RepID=A0A4R7V4D4_9PSEU|nr:hypothetical protein [Actinophytocola oryzae]TDV44288.1 hypothetical protein CLV71_114198 [Actinophytocola oryzae]